MRKFIPRLEFEKVSEIRYNIQFGKDRYRLIEDPFQEERLKVNSIVDPETGIRHFHFVANPLLLPKDRKLWEPALAFMIGTMDQTNLTQDRTRGSELEQAYLMCHLRPPQRALYNSIFY